MRHVLRLAGGARQLPELPGQVERGAAARRHVETGSDAIEPTVFAALTSGSRSPPMPRRGSPAASADRRCCRRSGGVSGWFSLTSRVTAPEPLFTVASGSDADVLPVHLHARPSGSRSWSGSRSTSRPTRQNALCCGARRRARAWRWAAGTRRDGTADARPGSCAPPAPARRCWPGRRCGAGTRWRRGRWRRARRRARVRRGRGTARI